MYEELDIQDWEAYIEYQNGWDEYMKDYQKRLEDIPIEEIEKFLRKRNKNNIEIQIKPR